MRRAPSITPVVAKIDARPKSTNGICAATPAADDEEEPEPDPPAVVDVGLGVKPIGPVSIEVADVAATAADEALFQNINFAIRRKHRKDTHAELAAPESLCSFKSTWSTMCKTPFQRTISGVTIFAVTLPLVMNPPEELNVELKLSPEPVVKLELCP